MNIYYDPKNHALYDGSQLRSLFAYLQYGISGSSIVSWRGPCNVATQNIVDGEDILLKSQIRGGDMLHFIAEIFNESLSFAVAFQRLMAAQTVAILNSPDFKRSGDDVYCKDRKLSISIATVSPISALIHFAVNVTNVDTPIPTCALSEFGIEADLFAQNLLTHMREEFDGIAFATTKVRWVR